MTRTLPFVVLLSVLSASALAQSPPPERRETGQHTEHVTSAGETGYRPSGPAPTFASLDSNGDRSITSEEAVRYELLANDFQMADGDRDGRIGQTEYDRWAARP